MIRRYVEAGKPVVGIRTASHAFDARGKAPQGHAEWPTFDPDVLGGHYTGHHANDLKPRVTDGQGRRGPSHPRGRETPFTGQGSLYKTSPLAASARALLVGEIPGHPAEPVAWVNLVGTRRGLLHLAGPSRRFREPLVPPAAPQCRLLGARTASRPTHESRGSLLNHGRRARSSPARRWRPSRFPTTSRSIWSCPSRSSASR